MPFGLELERDMGGWWGEGDGEFEMTSVDMSAIRVELAVEYWVYSLTMEESYRC